MPSPELTSDSWVKQKRNYWECCCRSLHHDLDFLYIMFFNPNWTAQEYASTLIQKLTQNMHNSIDPDEDADADDTRCSYAVPLQKSSWRQFEPINLDHEQEMHIVQADEVQQDIHQPIIRRQQQRHRPPAYLARFCLSLRNCATSLLPCRWRHGQVCEDMRPVPAAPMVSISEENRSLCPMVIQRKSSPIHQEHQVCDYEHEYAHMAELMRQKDWQESKRQQTELIGPARSESALFQPAVRPSSPASGETEIRSQSHVRVLVYASSTTNIVTGKPPLPPSAAVRRRQLIEQRRRSQLIATTWRRQSPPRRPPTPVITNKLPLAVIMEEAEMNNGYESPEEEPNWKREPEAPSCSPESESPEPGSPPELNLQKPPCRPVSPEPEMMYHLPIDKLAKKKKIKRRKDRRPKSPEHLSTSGNDDSAGSDRIPDRSKAILSPRSPRPSSARAKRFGSDTERPRRIAGRCNSEINTSSTSINYILATIHQITWSNSEVYCAQLKHLSKVAPFVLGQHISGLVDILIRKVAEPKPRESGPAIKVLRRLYDIAPELMEPVCEAVIGAMLDKLGGPLFIDTECIEIVNILLAYCDPVKACFALIKHGVSHRLNVSRCTAAKFLRDAMSKLDLRRAVGDQFPPQKRLTSGLFEAATCFVFDSNVNTRDFGREIFAILLNHHNFWRLYFKHVPQEYKTRINQLLDEIRDISATKLQPLPPFDWF